MGGWANISPSLLDFINLMFASSSRVKLVPEQMKRTFFYYLQVVLVTISGFCGLLLIIGGICMQSVLAATIGCCSMVLPILTLKYN